MTVVALEDAVVEKAVELNPWALCGWAESLLVRVPATGTDELTSEELDALVARVEHMADVVAYIADVLRDMARARVAEEFEEGVAESYGLPRPWLFGECRRKGIDSASCAEARLRGC